MKISGISAFPQQKRTKDIFDVKFDQPNSWESANPQQKQIILNISGIWSNIITSHPFSLRSWPAKNAFDRNEYTVWCRWGKTGLSPCSMENHHVQWEVDRRYRTTTDGCSIAMLVYRRVSLFFESLAVVTWKLLRFERPFWREKGRVEVEDKRI